MRDPSQAEQKESRGHWGALAALIRPFRKQVAGLAAFAAIGAALPLAGPLLLRAFVDGALAGNSTSKLLVPAVGYVAAAVAAQIMAIGVLWAATRLSWTITDGARVELADHILRHGLDFHHHHTPGELVERVDGDLTAVNDSLASFVITMMGMAFTVTAMVGVVAVLDWRIGLGLAAYVAVAVWTFMAIRDYAVADSALERGAVAQMYGGIEETLVGADDLRANGAGAHAMDRFEQDGRAVLAASIRRERAIIWLWHGATGAVTGGVVLSLVLGAAGTSLGWISVGTAFLLYQYMQLLQLPLEQIVEQLQEIQKAAGGILRVRALLDEVPDEPPATGPACPPDHLLGVSFRDVHFSYGDEPVLRGLDLDVAAGTSLGIVGATGGGKTTLGRLLTRTLSPTTGQLLLGGVDIGEIAEPDLRRAIGVVPQDVEIFSSSIRNNVCLFDPNIADSAIIDALEQVGLAHKLLADTGGLDRELVGDSGGLSAGEAQLLALSRVFLRNPAIVLLDEATSRVDPETEQRVLESIGRLLEGRTALVIAHRLATLQHVDRIAVLSGGVVAEVGDRAALLADDTIYARLVSLTNVKAQQ